MSVDVDLEICLRAAPQYHHAWPNSKRGIVVVSVSKRGVTDLSHAVTFQLNVLEWFCKIHSPRKCSLAKRHTWDYSISSTHMVNEPYLRTTRRHIDEVTIESMWAVSEIYIPLMDCYLPCPSSYMNYSSFFVRLVETMISFRENMPSANSPSFS